MEKPEQLINEKQILDHDEFMKDWNSFKLDEDNDKDKK